MNAMRCSEREASAMHANCRVNLTFMSSELRLLGNGTTSGVATVPVKKNSCLNH